MKKRGERKGLEDEKIKSRKKMMENGCYKR
jgi:hypothetical protein